MRLAAIVLLVAVATFGSRSARAQDAGAPPPDAGVASATPAPDAGSEGPVAPEPPAEPPSEPEPPSPALPEPGDLEAGGVADADAADLYADEDLPVETPVFQARLYGYLDAQGRGPLGEPLEEGHSDTPGGADEHHAGFDLDAVVMLQGSIYERYRWFVNAVASGAADPSPEATIDLRNAWLELPLLGDALVVRAGKTYRRFGLYNEILDAVPTFMGIEAPEMLVPGHLFMTRTTNLMVHGSVTADDHGFTYSLMTGNDEAGEGVLPVGADLHYDFVDIVRIGTSFYSTLGAAQPTVRPGEGVSGGGVFPWMESDEFMVFGVYGRLHLEGLIVEAEFWHSPHSAKRDRDRTLLLAQRARLRQRNLDRFFVGGTPMPTPADVIVDVDYTVQTFWARAGYEIALDDTSTLTPYLHVDWLSNPESIPDEGFGGNEPGLADNGQFLRFAVGGVYRPFPEVAIKLEYNPHLLERLGRSELFHELRGSLSYAWELPQ